MSSTKNRATHRKNRHARTDQAQRPPRHRAAHRRALRREAPTVVALLLDGEDFAALTDHRTFAFDNYAQYLHAVDAFLRHLHAQGHHIAVTLFDPDAYADYCTTTRQPPDSATTRTHYTAEATAAGPSVTYTSQSLTLLRAQLAHEADRRATWESATDALTRAGTCPDCGQDLAHCAFDRASDTLLRLIETVGPGTHHVVCSLPADDGPLLAAVHVHADTDDTIELAENDALVLCTVMAASTATGRTGGVVLRTTHDDERPDTVRGWSLRDGHLHPLTEAEVFNAYCTDAATGDPVPPEHGVVYRAGLPLPPPPIDHIGPIGPFGPLA
ncbi:hypothetical protein [Streptomyces sp. CBMA29]|uniref:hypothetical protein n=1 Tax=Streptomyces sp. CBMA29 TaxID=1896314 RepID=UPI001661B653|nr:hypothetical protein [Streptomyces sp. CBMA29]MBD0739998.1 hypothetical protein [Streptomyces sp. CBMA29]